MLYETDREPECLAFIGQTESYNVKRLHSTSTITGKLRERITSGWGIRGGNMVVWEVISDWLISPGSGSMLRSEEGYMYDTKKESLVYQCQ